MPYFYLKAKFVVKLEKLNYLSDALEKTSLRSPKNSAIRSPKMKKSTLGLNLLFENVYLFFSEIKRLTYVILRIV